MTGSFGGGEKIAFLRELLSCGTRIDLWQYASDGHLVASTSEHLVLDRFFENAGCKEYMIAHAGKYTAPLILGGPLGLMWCAVYRRLDAGGCIFYVLGPVYNSEMSARTIEESARRFPIEMGWQSTFIQMMKSLPVVSSILFFQYALMLHYCVTGEKLDRSDLPFQEWTPQETDDGSGPPQRDRMRVWQAERALLDMVREGDIHYQEALSNANLLSGGVHISGRDPLMQAIVSCANFTALCTREAIQAGLSPETAYSVGDSYIQSMVDCKTISELRSVNHAMYEDFILRVHKHRTGPRVSSQIAACRDYIELHAEEPLSLELLARRVGYSACHLSRKFRREMGVPVGTYIQYARVERAKLLLTATDKSVREIAAQLRFCSGSHFADVFRKIAGKTPQRYREETRKV